MVMKYTVRKLEKRENIIHCPICAIDKFNWGGEYRPAAFGQIGLLPGQILSVHMWAQEDNPAAVYTKDQEPVYLDSALEFFIQPLSEERKCYHEQHDEEYFNFEINSLGAMLAQKGRNKTNRIFLEETLMHQLDCQTKKEQDCWHVCLTLPLALLSHEPVIAFRFNFYKIQEGPGNTHFSSYAPISWDTPNFHLPQFFALAAFEEVSALYY